MVNNRSKYGSNNSYKIILYRTNSEFNKAVNKFKETNSNFNISKR